MRIQWMNVVVGVGAGAVDEVMEMQDEKGGRTVPFKTWTDWSRIGLAAIGYLGQIFNFFPAVASPLAQSEVTLFTKTVGKAIRARTGTTAVVTRTSTGALPATPATAPMGSRRVGWRPLPVGV
jgi:hypothetical protein